VHTVRDRCYQEQGQLHCTVGEDVQLNQAGLGHKSGQVRSKGIEIPRPNTKTDGRRERSKVHGQTGQNTQTIRHKMTAIHHYTIYITSTSDYNQISVTLININLY